ncbi:FecCD family ABC transporter permease [Streptomonospora litoralis]|uniref:Putative siderophore transport system permease protein YfiZ n=1 Tax=Streptomonospora litoralis TaxID=2498135 RepID=A0A4P6Q9V9_9ACTN|nr:iron ABC transporter permease [Streptomonospora litoralis]QBI55927.1 putative siderophore transport system permease protein YfiZ precursor [Streptomonospora litoralis]
MNTSAPAPPRGSGAVETAAPGGEPHLRSRLAGLLLLLLALALCAALSVAVGSRGIAPAEIWRVLLAPDGGEASTIVHEMRMPRTLLGLVVGVALGVSGVLMQSHTRNPIADPSLLGVAYGAACAVVLSVFLFGLASLSAYIWFAIGGALAASVAVFAIASGGSRGPTPVTLLLAGAAMTALLSGITAGVVLLDERSLEVYRFWRVGSLSGRPEGVTTQILPFAAVGLALAAAGTRGMNALALGDDVATALGHRVRLIRASGVAAIALMTGAAVAAAGPIGFVGLVAPHAARAARAATGPDHRWLLPYAALCGAALVLAADVAGRVVRGSGEVEVGIVLAVFGGPFFITLIRRRRLVEL